MALTVRDLPQILISSGSSPKTGWTGLLDDANSITIFLTSASGVVSSNVTVEVSPIDFALPLGNQGVVANASSSAFYTLSSAVLSSGILAFTLSNISFRSFRLATSANALTTGTLIALATKQVSV